MKLFINYGRPARFFPVALALAALSGQVACTGKSNAEDDTFRQSIIDDPVKAQRENEAAKLGKDIKKLDTTAADSLRTR